MRRLLRCAVVIVLLAGCRRAGAHEVETGPAETIVFEGMCDASGAVVIDAWRFAVADDEDNLIRIYDVRTGGRPVHVSDLSPALDLTLKKKWPETDIEAATGLKGTAFWLTSHGRKSSGKVDPSRFRFFATRADPANGNVSLVGTPYTLLLDDLLMASELRTFDLEKASQRAPKEPGGLNIEGMTAMEDGESILIGFRNPVPEGRALLIPLRNPAAMIEGERARFGAPRLLDLEGGGVRAISWWRGRYLLVGGAFDSGSSVPSRLYTWRWNDPKPQRVNVDFTGWNPEGFVSWEDKERILVLSDDGSVLVEGVECKRLKDPSRKRFRAGWVRP